MKTEQEKLISLTNYSVWRFPKQDTSFDNAFRATQLFNNISDKSSNVEKYFKDNYKRFEVTTDRHRMLVISQMYGLLTKSPFYKRGSPYSDEKPTEIFKLMNTFKIGDKNYNKIKTEQILKIKMRAIIDTTDHCIGWNIFPVIYSYQVLKELKEKHKILKISLPVFYTYVMTCMDFSEKQESVHLLSEKGNKSDFYIQYLNDSRFINILKENISLFKFENDNISINPKYDEYFETQFINKHNILDFTAHLANDKEYAKFLYNPQNFGINLLDEIDSRETIVLPEKIKSEVLKKNDISQIVVIKNRQKLIETEIEDTEYNIDVDIVSDLHINNYLGTDSHKTPPVFPQMALTSKYSKNPIIGKSAIFIANYICENDYSHETFISSSTSKTFMEAHHLIPISNQRLFWDKYNLNIDCIENLVSLCPTCHRAIHYAIEKEKLKIIESLYNKRISSFKKIGLNITLDELIKLYV